MTNYFCENLVFSFYFVHFNIFLPSKLSYIGWAEAYLGVFNERTYAMDFQYSKAERREAKGEHTLSMV